MDKLYELKHNIKDYTIAGKSIITIEDEGERFTYKINRKKSDTDGETIWFVKILYGTNNYSDYKFLCFFREDMKVRTSKKSCASYDAPSMQMFRRFMKHIDYLPNELNTMKVYHSGKCGRCGRRLTVPESIMTGLGPECAKKS